MGTSLSWRTDTQLHDAVRLRLDEAPAIPAHDIAVVASDGVITLTGFVDSYTEKVAAEEVVKQVRGVRAVANGIELRIRAERTDPEIARDAIHMLDSLPIAPHRVTVVVRHGFVTLDGNVGSTDQKEATESAIHPLRGVRGVSSRIRVMNEVSHGS